MSKKNPPALPVRIRRETFGHTIRKDWMLLLMLLPAVLYTLVFHYLPMSGLVLSFKQFNYVDGVFGSPWNGLDNFRFLLISGKLGTLTSATLLYNFGFIVVNTFLEVLIAVFLNEITCKWFKKSFQSFIFLPYFISWVVAAAIVQALLSYEYGAINKILEIVSGNKININTTASVWPTLLVTLSAWKSVGYGSVVYLSAITGIDPGLYEAAELDGANKWQQIRYVTLPALLSTVIIMVLLAVGRIFRGDFGMFYQLIGNNGVLLRKTDILDTYIYRSMLGNSNLGMTAAAGFYQSVLCFVTIMAVNALVKWIEPDYSLF
ncbi:MAG: sugar ABC transporter permease [Clostridia bacterium]|jgi:putative aldouronate transport system permease protein|nr:sugar ABC transporter permease [Clostridia bacterium]